MGSRIVFHLVLKRNQVASFLFMVVYSSIEDARNHLSGNGHRCYEVVCTYDSRVQDANHFVESFNDLKAQWAAKPYRVYLKLFGIHCLPSAWKAIPLVWVKVHLARLICRWKRVAYFCWLDGDATVNPILRMGDDVKNRHSEKKLIFHSLQDVCVQYAASKTIVFVGYRDNSASSHLACPQNCNCNSKHHRCFNAGAWICVAPCAKTILQQWVDL